MLTVYNDCCCTGPAGPPGPPGPPGPIGPGLLSEIVLLPDNASTEIIITNCTNVGCYKILVKALVAGGATATFDCSKADDTLNGQTERVTNAPAAAPNLERLQLVWRLGNRPALYHDPTRVGGVGINLSYNVTIMHNF